jgi:predicted metal-dependent enzyme (double-stranded beta helix superfamily)
VFDLDEFIAECRAAVAADPTHKGVREVLLRAVSDPAAVVKALGEPRLAGVEPLYRSPELTILNVVWGPLMTVMPHEHRMWAVIGVYSGREDNVFWRRIGGEGGRTRIEAAGAKALSVKDAEPLGRDVIHSVTNPLQRLSGAIHAYGGDFFAVARSEWDAETLIERPYDRERNMRLFVEANARWGLA